MVESTCFQHTSSHPDKHNNSVDRIISKEEEREDPRRDTSVFFKYSGVSTNNTHSTRTTVFPHAIQQLQDILHTELILLQEFSKKYYNYKAHPVSSCADHYKASSSNCSHVSKHSTWQNKAPGFPTAFQDHTAQAGFQQFYPVETAF